MSLPAVPLTPERLREAQVYLAWGRSLDRKQQTFDEYVAGVCRPEREGARRREPQTRPHRKERTR